MNDNATTRQVQILSDRSESRPFDKEVFLGTISRLSNGLSVNPQAIVDEIATLLPDESIHEWEFDDLAARTVAARTLQHHHHGILGGRIWPSPYSEW